MCESAAIEMTVETWISLHQQLQQYIEKGSPLSSSGPLMHLF
jgi:hypothetical protein